MGGGGGTAGVGCGRTQGEIHFENTPEGHMIKSRQEKRVYIILKCSF